MKDSKGFERKSTTAWVSQDVNEKYESLSKVGAGTYGEVHKARSKSDPTQIVALKKIKTERETEGFPITAIREITILKQLNHPNIVRLLDVATSKDPLSIENKKKSSTYLVFEYMNHELLGLSNMCQFTFPQIKCIMKQILEGLAYMHSKNILHRDIKSANILMNNKGEVKIADFGLAKTVNPSVSGRLTQRVVTRWYRAPELLLGSRNYTGKIDVWALGCVFAELLIGKSQPLFKAQKTPDQFEIICEKCGTPTEKQWPSYKALPFFPHVAPKKNYSKTLMEHMISQRNDLDDLSLDLLDKMLTINPDDRITAREALQHPYFSSAPLPCELSEMPKVAEDCHAYVLKTQIRESTDIGKKIEAITSKGIHQNFMKGMNPQPNLTNNYTNTSYSRYTLPNKLNNSLPKNDPKKGIKSQVPITNKESSYSSKLKTQVIHKESIMTRSTVIGQGQLHRVPSLVTSQESLLFTTSMQCIEDKSTSQTECFSTEASICQGMNEDRKESGYGVKKIEKWYGKRESQEINGKRGNGYNITEFEEIAAKKQLVDVVKYTN